MSPVPKGRAGSLRQPREEGSGGDSGTLGAPGAGWLGWTDVVEPPCCGVACRCSTSPCPPLHRRPRPWPPGWLGTTSSQAALTTQGRCPLPGGGWLREAFPVTEGRDCNVSSLKGSHPVPSPGSVMDSPSGVQGGWSRVSTRQAAHRAERRAWECLRGSGQGSALGWVG